MYQSKPFQNQIHFTDTVRCGRRLSDHDSIGGLRRTLGVFDLTLMGVAAIVGAGIFAMIGKAAHDGGPAFALLFVFTAFACEVDRPMGKTPVTLKAKSEGGKLNMSKASSFSGPMGEVTITTKETWELAADGKSLTVNREQSTPRGATSSTLVFSKK